MSKCRCKDCIFWTPLEREEAKISIYGTCNVPVPTWAEGVCSGGRTPYINGFIERVCRTFKRKKNQRQKEEGIKNEGKRIYPKP